MSITSNYQAKRIVIVGAHSRLGRAVIAISPNNIIGVSRRAFIEAGYDNVRVDCYSSVTEKHFSDIDVVINCTGLVTGTYPALQRANYEIPLDLANKARSAGVRQFIQISSFAVYTNGQIISAATPVEPQSNYGKTKLLGDRGLLDLSTSAFRVSCVRLPALYGAGNSKLKQLLKLWSRLKLLPVPRHDVMRSMMHYDLAAECLYKMCHEPSEGIQFAADPEPFSYYRTRAFLSQKKDVPPLQLLTLPNPVFQIGQKIVPHLLGKLYSNMMVSTQENRAESFKLKSRLYQDIYMYMKMQNGR